MTNEELKQEAREWSFRKKYAYGYAYTFEQVTNAYIEGAEPREKRIAELEAQIEKMKCCFNCKHSRTEYEHCKTDKHEKWEIKEK